jgi:hypothetical protein
MRPDGFLQAPCRRDIAYQPALRRMEADPFTWPLEQAELACIERRRPPWFVFRSRDCDGIMVRSPAPASALALTGAMTCGVVPRRGAQRGRGEVKPRYFEVLSPAEVQQIDLDVARRRTMADYEAAE